MPTAYLVEVQCVRIGEFVFLALIMDEDRHVVRGQNVGLEGERLIKKYQKVAQSKISAIGMNAW